MWHTFKLYRLCCTIRNDLYSHLDLLKQWTYELNLRDNSNSVQV